MTYRPALAGASGSVRRPTPGSSQKVVGRLVPVVEVDGFGDRAATNRPVLALGPSDHDVAGNHPILGYADGFPQQRLAAVRSPAGETRPQTLGAGGQHKVLHGGEDRPAKQKFGRRRE